MNVSSPHYLLLSDTVQGNKLGRWRFVLRASDGSDVVEAIDFEPEARGQRLELLTVVRGLEALQQPSRVTLLTTSSYVREGLCYGLQDWRHNGWQWERFGHLVPVKDSDLWQRLDRVMQYHQIDCRVWRFDSAHGSSPSGEGSVRNEQTNSKHRQKPRRWWRGRLARLRSLTRILSSKASQSGEEAREGSSLVHCL